MSVRALIATGSFAGSTLIASVLANAGEPLGYTTRTSSYTGHSSAVSGDIRTIGRAGAVAAAPDSPYAIHVNPAGPAAFGFGPAAQMTFRSISDTAVQNFDYPMRTFSIGTTLEYFPWGFGIAYHTPRREGLTYTLPNSTDRTIGIATEEVRFSAARLLFDHRLALGAAIALTSGSINFERFVNTQWAPRLSVGALYLLPLNLTIGAAFNTETTLFTGNAADPGDPGLAGVFQNIHVPFRSHFGVAWTPNMFFRSGFTLEYIGVSQNTALLRNNTEWVGLAPNWQPRLGFTYMAIDLREIDIFLSGGVYYEMSRTTQTSDRLHWTVGFEFRPYIFALGWAIDSAPGYRNSVFTFTLDFLKTFSRLGVIPRMPVPPTGGVLPNPFRHSTTNLPRYFVDNWGEDPRSKVKRIDVPEISRTLRENLKKGIENGPSELEQVGKDLKDDLNDLVHP